MDSHAQGAILKPSHTFFIASVLIIRGAGLEEKHFSGVL
jgi:hypothetical protein